MPGPWWEADLEAVFSDAFNDGPLVYMGSTTGCVIKDHDAQMGGVGIQDVTDRVILCHYATNAMLIVPTIGSTVSVAGANYVVRHKENKDAGVTCLYLVAQP